jgi:hypothetical protein
MSVFCAGGAFSFSIRKGDDVLIVPSNLIDEKIGIPFPLFVFLSRS